MISVQVGKGDDCEGGCVCVHVSSCRDGQPASPGPAICGGGGQHSLPAGDGRVRCGEGEDCTSQAGEVAEIRRQ